eukprot:403370338
MWCLEIRFDWQRHTLSWMSNGDERLFETQNIEECDSKVYFLSSPHYRYWIEN